MHEALKVVFVEDDDDVRDSLAQTLELAGFEVCPCDCAEAALSHLSPRFAGIVVSDVHLPGMDGLALMRHVLDADAGVPVILVTGQGDVAMAVRAIREGAYDFIEKPFTAGRLVEAARGAARQCALRPAAPGGEDPPGR
jgi:two-component system response regulator AauR